MNPICKPCFLIRRSKCVSGVTRPERSVDVAVGSVRSHGAPRSGGRACTACCRAAIRRGSPQDTAGLVVPGVLAGRRDVVEGDPEAAAGALHRMSRGLESLGDGIDAPVPPPARRQRLRVADADAERRLPRAEIAGVRNAPRARCA